MNERLQKAIETVTGDFNQISELPDEIPLWAARDDEELEEMLSMIITNLVLRQEDSIRKVAEIIASIQNAFATPESLREFYESRGHVLPKLTEEMLQYKQTVQTERAMYLQWKEINTLNTREDDE